MAVYIFQTRDFQRSHKGVVGCKKIEKKNQFCEKQTVFIYKCLSILLCRLYILYDEESCCHI